jgi:hypothetical protein
MEPAARKIGPKCSTLSAALFVDPRAPRSARLRRPRVAGVASARLAERVFDSMRA